MNGTDAPPEGVAQFYATLDAAIAKFTEQEAEERAFQEQHKDTYRRLRGEFTRAERKFLGQAGLVQDVTARAVIRRDAGRAPRIQRTIRTAPSRGDPSSTDDLPPLPIGVLHSDTRCAWCGAGADLYPTVLAVTRAHALVCGDVVACVRRRRAA